MKNTQTLQKIQTTENINLMKDKYEDINSLIYRNIMRRIRKYFKRKRIQNLKKIIIVGDQRQSIYQFRGCQENVFGKSKKLLKRKQIDYNMEKLQKTQRFGIKVVIYNVIYEMEMTTDIILMILSDQNQ
ncbi:UvrD/REP helicase amine-terminal domain protein (macronuclear) [Tetrahymena thermophila SB210]|uniref:UvrD/REP helicase amine-terminal domain protein n=1 Tax=Tetrahymena thermophila (strain SB210) TaxID=312017 RepID=W7XI31_TETTS|nr:UvrD/REP helicase amine-terminal domain protein [Tetrahymena thermophila SB210]EWS72939.1 UvrD/REP helicase amine-terminal domain protein [Tetrahymena thermophila SB210]|eukprot:XP_012654526.1 UvrD/REP helicase amine-terminal domain protein [Tetrahymena thermophila SB210]